MELEHFLGEWRDSLGNRVVVDWATPGNRRGQLEVQLTRPRSREPVRLNVKSLGNNSFACGHYELDLEKSHPGKIVWVDCRSYAKSSIWERPGNDQKSTWGSQESWHGWKREAWKEEWSEEARKEFAPPALWPAVTNFPLPVSPPMWAALTPGAWAPPPGPERDLLPFELGYAHEERKPVPQSSELPSNTHTDTDSFTTQAKRQRSSEPGEVHSKAAPPRPSDTTPLAWDPDGLEEPDASDLLDELLPACVREESPNRPWYPPSGPPALHPVDVAAAIPSDPRLPSKVVHSLLSLVEADVEAEPSPTDPLEPRAEPLPADPERASAIPSHVEWRPVIEAMYQRYNVEKLPELDKILLKYKGCESDLYWALIAKYAPKDQHGTAHGEWDTQRSSEIQPAFECDGPDTHGHKRRRRSESSST